MFDLFRSAPKRLPAALTLWLLRQYFASLKEEYPQTEVKARLNAIQDHLKALEDVIPRDSLTVPTLPSVSSIPSVDYEKIAKFCTEMNAQLRFEKGEAEGDEEVRIYITFRTPLDALDKVFPNDWLVTNDIMNSLAVVYRHDHEWKALIVQEIAKQTMFATESARTLKGTRYRPPPVVALRTDVDNDVYVIFKLSNPHFVLVLSNSFIVPYDERYRDIPGIHIIE